MIPQLKERDISWLTNNIQRANICEDFDEATLNAIGSDVLKWHEIDDESRSEWKEQVMIGMDIAKQTLEKGNGPIGALSAKTKDPLIAEAAMNFSARAMAEVVRGKDIVKTEVVGDDPTGTKESRGKRVSQCMSYQLTKQQPEWIPDTDQLLTSMPIIGMYYKFTYRDAENNRNVSCSLSPLETVVHNDTKTLSLADRIGREFKRNKNYIIEKIRANQWADIEAKLSPEEDCPLQDFVEQYCWYDLDADGYKEPYLITVHKESGAVARICVCYDEDGLVTEGSKVLRITPVEYYTEFSFLLQPDGSFHKMGFAQLLGAINQEINTLQNQLIDSGTIANLRPGFIGKGAKLPAGGIVAKVGRLTPVESNGQDLRANIYFPDFAGPSDTLFKLLGLLDEKGHKLASISEGMQGETGGANVPATTTLALLDQALKIYTSILWRQYRSFEQEFIKLYKLNAQYLTDKEYIKIVDITAEDLQAMGIDQSQITESSQILVSKDFDIENCDIEPVMDPKASSEALRLARLNAMAQAAGMPPAVGRIYLKGIGCSQKDIDDIFPPPQIDPQTGQPVPPPPDPKMIEVQAKITQMAHQGEQKDRELALKHMEMEQKETVALYTIEKLQAEIAHIKATSILALAQAEAAEVGTQMGVYQSELDQLNADREHELAVISQKMEAQGGENGTGTGNDGDSTGKSSDAKTVAQPEDNQADNGAPQDAAGVVGAATSTGADGIVTGDSGDAMGVSIGNNSGARPDTTAAALADAERRPMH
jgi:hypothetical protein